MPHRLIDRGSVDCGSVAGEAVAGESVAIRTLVSKDPAATSLGGGDVVGSIAGQQRQVVAQPGVGLMVRE